MNKLTILYLYLFSLNYWRFSLVVMSAYPRDLVIMFVAIIGFKVILSDTVFRQKIFPFILIILLVTNISSIYLLMVKSVPFNVLLKRVIIQSFRLFTLTIEVYLGFRFLTYFQAKDFLRIQYLVIRFLLGAGLYQFIAFQVGLPYWGILMGSPNYGMSADYGIRPNSFVGEPKVFAVYAVLAMLFIFFLRKDEKRGSLSLIIWFLIGLFCFWRAESGNGVLAILIVIVVRFFLLNINYYFKLGTLVVILYSGYLIFSQPELFFSRNLDRLSAISNLDFSLLFYSMDDLVLLPSLALLKYKLCILFGFGKGLVTFYAKDFLHLAVWIEEGANLDSNIKFIAIISNYGLILTIFAVRLVIKNYLLIKKKAQDVNILIMSEFLLDSFFVAIFVAGNNALMWFSLGFFLRGISDITLDKNERNNE